MSRHASQQPRPVLTVHVTGNFGPADYGGTPGTLTPAVTPLMHALLRGLVKYAPPGYEVMYEATHHGPTRVPIPSCFVEIGSTEKEWHDREGAAAVAAAVLDAVLTDLPDVIPLAGFGGTHYAQRQTEITKTTRGGFGHIMPSRDLRYLTRELFDLMVSDSGAAAVYLDGKSLSGPEEKKITTYARERGIPVLGQGDLQRLNRLPFSQYLAVKKLAESVVPGCNIVIHALDDAPDPAVLEIPGDLLEEVMRAVPDDFIASLDRYPLARITGGGKACHPKFIIDGGNEAEISDELIHLCVILVQSRYDCSFDGDFFVIRKKRFDAKKAEKLGIPAGPLYGDLMAGRPVTMNGSVVDPEMVLMMTEKRIHIPKRQER
ncbi:MAG: D-tyrosyl-tRNA(Tyr) deacylase [Methanospirillum sp.]|nr:D-tyrosyl-tRNA(Tyr) deacylase [Methanospirillum sp.]